MPSSPQLLPPCAVIVQVHGDKPLHIVLKVDGLDGDAGPLQGLPQQGIVAAHAAYADGVEIYGQDAFAGLFRFDSQILRQYVGQLSGLVKIQGFELCQPVDGYIGLDNG